MRLNAQTYANLECLGMKWDELGGEEERTKGFKSAGFRQHRKQLRRPLLNSDERL
jgi:hypothetical protein